jgi:hypothetical protein|tara:strand:- start:101 stop:487 length:387 start_codon:yes stop_codon:yes gene_type:complete
VGKMAKKKAKKREGFNFDRAIFLLLMLALFVIFKTSLAPPKAANLMQEAETVINILTNEKTEASLLTQNSLTEEKVENLDYDEIKNIIGVENDFCIFFEDINGNLVKIDDMDPGIGYDKIYINGKPCK